MAKVVKCIYCGKKLKPNKEGKECYGCKCTGRFINNGLSTPRTKVDAAIKHLNKKPGVLQAIFNI